jgi:hypothetical protein
MRAKNEGVAAKCSGEELSFFIKEVKVLRGT